MTGGGSDSVRDPRAGDGWAEDAAAYAVGALDAAERAVFEEHLATCGECAAEVRDSREVATLLAKGFGGAAAAPSPALRERIMAEAVAAEALAAGRPAARQQSQQPALPLRPRTATAPPTASIRVARPAWRATVWTPWLAAAALVVAVGLGTGWARERQVRLAERQRSVTAFRELAAEVTRRTTLIDGARDSLFAAVTAPDVRVARLAVPGAPAAMRLLWNPERGIVVLTATAMPRPHAGKTYQLWGIPRRGAPQSLGVFAPGVDGRVRAVLRVPPEAEMRLAAVTEEPDGGSARPTSAPLMVGEMGGS